MKESTAFMYFKDACKDSRLRINAFCGAVFGTWGLIGSFFCKEVTFYVLSFLACITIIFALYNILVLYRKLSGGRLDVSLLGERKVTLLQNGYPENMELLFQEKSAEELKNFAFVMGFDRTGNLSISSLGGVVYSVLKDLKARYHCLDEKGNSITPLEEAQRQVKDYLKKHEQDWVDETNKLNYGDCVEVRLNLIPRQNTGKDAIPCNLILVANSRQNNPEEGNTPSEDLNDDNQSNIIVPKVFDYLLRVKSYTGVMIGVMGTNAMGQKYSVIFSQIINQYARLFYKEKRVHLGQLYISIREKDYKAHNMTLIQLTDHVRRCALYYT